jgi:hypothetical protein
MYRGPSYLEYADFVTVHLFPDTMNGTTARNAASARASVKDIQVVQDLRSQVGAARLLEGDPVRTGIKAAKNVAVHREEISIGLGDVEDKKPVGSNPP